MVMYRLAPSIHHSPWPPILSFLLLAFMFSLALMLKSSNFLLNFVIFGVLMSLLTIWYRDMGREACSGEYTAHSFDIVKLGFSLFIFSESTFFFSFFWTFFHFSLCPSVFGGLSWPPIGVESVSGLGIPLLNTALLLSSGLSVSWAHKAMGCGLKGESIMGLSVTILLGSFFLLNQIFEFNEATFTISDGVYGSVFFTLTGFHALHVFVGLILLGVTLNRTVFGYFHSLGHTQSDLAVWYWHFVDVIWIFVYSLIYWWGGS